MLDFVFFFYFNTNAVHLNNVNNLRNLSKGNLVEGERKQKHKHIL